MLEFIGDQGKRPVAEFLGDSKRVAERRYVYALTDYRDADYGKLLERVRTVHTP